MAFFRRWGASSPLGEAGLEIRAMAKGMADRTSQWGRKIRILMACWGILVLGG